MPPSLLLSLSRSAALFRPAAALTARSVGATTASTAIKTSQVLLPLRFRFSSTKAADEAIEYKSVVEFDDCRSYLLHRLGARPGEPPDEAAWTDIAEEITGTLPAMKVEDFSLEDEEGSDRRKRISLKRKIKRGVTALKPHTRDLFVFNLCLEKGWLAAAVSYAEFVSGRGGWDAVTQAQKEALLLTAARSEWGEAEADPELERRLLRICDRVEEDVKGIVGKPGRVLGWLLVAAKAKTSKWRDALELSRRKSSVEPPSELDNRCHEAAINLVLRSVREGDGESAWERADHASFHLNRQSVREEPAEAVDELAALWMDSCFGEKNEDVRKARLEEMLRYFGRIGYFLRPPVLERLWEEAAKTEAVFELEETTVRQNGLCEATGATLPRVTVSQEEFAKLREAVVSKVLVKDDVYATSTPDEFRKFRAKFGKSSNRMTRYDVVVDGLNVALGNDTVLTANEKGQRLLSLVKHLTQSRNRVLVITREHTKGFRQMRSIEQICRVEFVQNASEDDPFLIAATLHSGAGAKFVSNDVMRQHICLLDTQELRDIFGKWQAQAQIKHEFVRQGYRKVDRPTLHYPPEHVLSSCLVSGTWHLPMANEEVEGETKFMVPPKRWLCLKFK